MVIFYITGPQVSMTDPTVGKDLLGDLNPPQQEAVVAGDRAILVFAGAGSGKTRVLTYRIAYLIHIGKVAPEEVLASLFSKIIKERDYFSSDGANWSRGDRDFANDEYLEPAEARALAHAVVEYRNAYYDAYKPSISGGGFDYRHSAGGMRCVGV